MSQKRFYDSSTNDLFMVIGPNSTQDPWELEEVRFNLSTGASTGTESFTVTVHSGLGTAYNCELFSQSMSSVTDLFWQPNRPIEFAPNDKAILAWVNDASSMKIWGLEAIIKIGGQ